MIGSWHGNCRGDKFAEMWLRAPRGGKPELATVVAEGRGLRRTIFPGGDPLAISVPVRDGVSTLTSWTIARPDKPDKVVARAELSVRVSNRACKPARARVRLVRRSGG